jgi:hypothetical protein
MRRILSGFLRVKRTRHERKSDAACGLRVARQRGKPKAAAGSSQVFPIPSILKAIGRSRALKERCFYPRYPMGGNECRKLCLTLTRLTRPAIEALLLSKI